MSRKPIYEELEQAAKELKEKALQIEQAEAAVRESEERYRLLSWPALLVTCRRQ